MLKLTLALAAGLIMPFTIGHADDQQTETLHNNSYQYNALSFCSSSACEVVFPTTEHIQTVVQSVSCDMQVTSGAAPFLVRLSAGGTEAYNALPVFYYSTLSSVTLMGINTPTTFFISKGNKPRVTFETSGGTVSYLNCTIAGYHS
jgi:hypothetical protein